MDKTGTEVKQVITILDDDEWFIELRFSHQDIIYGPLQGGMLPYVASIIRNKGPRLAQVLRINEDFIADPRFKSYIEETLKDKWHEHTFAAKHKAFIDAHKERLNEKANND